MNEEKLFKFHDYYCTRCHKIVVRRIPLDTEKIFVENRCPSCGELTATKLSVQIQKTLEQLKESKNALS